MSKTLVKFAAALAFIAGVVAAVPGTAEARYWRHHGHYGGWGWGPRVYYGYPYAYRPYYYAPPDCGYVRVRVWRDGRWRLRRVWRCY